MKPKSIVNKISAILNSASEGFMVAALVGLFALPVVIAKNVEPSITNSELSLVNPPRVVSFVEAPQPPQNLAQSAGPASGDVLGVATTRAMLEKMISVDDSDLNVFNRVVQKNNQDKFTISVQASSRFQKTRLFTIQNSFEEPREIILEVSLTNGTRPSVTAPRAVYLNDEKHVIGDEVFSKNVVLTPGSKLVVYVDSPKASPTALLAEVKVAK